MNKVCLLVPLVLFSIRMFAQTNADQVKMPSSVYLSYNGGFTSPGIRTGIEFPIRTIDKTRLKRNGNLKQVEKSRFLTSNIGWYHHEGFHDNLNLTIGYKCCRTNSKGSFTHIAPEIGYSRTFLGGTAYQVSDNGTVSINKNAGYNYALISIGGGVGYDFSVTKSQPFSLFLKSNIMCMFPYNNTLYLKPTLEVGVIFTPSNFLSTNTKQVTK